MLELGFREKAKNIATQRRISAILGMLRLCYFHSIRPRQRWGLRQGAPPASLSPPMRRRQLLRCSKHIRRHPQSKFLILVPGHLRECVQTRALLLSKSPKVFRVLQRCGYSLRSRRYAVYCYSCSLDVSFFGCATKALLPFSRLRGLGRLLLRSACWWDRLAREISPKPNPKRGSGMVRMVRLCWDNKSVPVPGARINLHTTDCKSKRHDGRGNGEAQQLIVLFLA